VSDVHLAQEDPSDEVLRHEASRWREARAGCPDPDLLLARQSELLEPTVSESLARHLEACDACARLAADIAALGLDAPDRVVEDRVFARAAGATSRTSSWRVPLAAIVLLACGAAAIWWMRPPAGGSPAVTGVRPSPSAAPAPAAPILALWSIEPLAVRVPISSLGVPRSAVSAGDGPGALADALAPYQAGRYAEAIPALEAVTRAQPRSADAALYLGVTYLLSDRPAEALAELERAAGLAADTRRDDLAWYLATAEQRTGRVEAARPRLQALCRGSGDYRARACAADERLR
jgi:hypothetical protein